MNLAPMGYNVTRILFMYCKFATTWILVVAKEVGDKFHQNFQASL
jgi:hypothetical protein